MKSLRHIIQLSIASMMFCMLSACGYKIVRESPSMALPEQFGATAAVRQALQNSADTQINVDAQWWQLLNDSVLNELQNRLMSGNQNLKASAAQVRQAKATLEAAQASLWPSLGVNSGATRGTTVTNPNVTNIFTLNAPISWELDVWGRIDAQGAVARSGLLASQEDEAAARLSLQATLVQLYIGLRTAEAQKDVLNRAEQTYAKALQLTEYRYQAGVVSAADVAQAQVQLRGAQAQAIDVATTRQQLLHAIAVLLGEMPSQLNVIATANIPTTPALPDVIPASLLQRRPDIRAAQMRVVSANAQVGVARAAFFPTVTFAASSGYRSNDMSTLVSSATRAWSLGPAIALSVFDGGARRAASDQALALVDQTSAQYRQVVLTAVQEVEDNLIAIAQLQEQAKAQSQVLQAANKNLDIAQAQYAAGTVSFLNVALAQASALTAERSLLDVKSRQAVAVNVLMKNLAGRWGV